ncbi:MAG: glycerol-3-phosphate 1-O-acyltransferase PlsY [Gammaproteobacteria bacterium]|nr:glycerol-3-phosphate 1-O-acyltransferase PlsY [Gammaproteobacteria bacterium]
MILDTILIVFGYLMGSTSAAIIVCRMMSLPDPRTEGSNNPGATNVLRIGGKKPAAITLAGDFLKGLIPVSLAIGLGASDSIIALTGIAALLGHLFPLFFGFQGGKGVATGLGVLLGFSWLVAACVALTWLIVAKVFRISSLSALVATLFTPLFVWFLSSITFFIASIIMSILVLYRHTDNIKRLLKGKEGEIIE